MSGAIDAARDAAARAVADRQFERHPELAERYGARGYERTVEDAKFHLVYLAEAVATALPSLFADYIAWARVVLAERRVPLEYLTESLELLADALDERLPGHAAEVARRYVEEALRVIPGPVDEPPSFIQPGAPHAALARRYLELLLDGRRHEAGRLVLDEVEAGLPAREVYLHVFQPAQLEVGRLWQVNRITVAQEHYCTAATQLVMSQLYPHVFSSERVGLSMVAACAADNLHEMGLRMVADFFEMAGWDTYYLGANVPVASVVSAVKERRADLLAVSATALFHIGSVVDLIAAVRADPACAGVKILVGGHPFNAEPDLWRLVGADACSTGAVDAVETGVRLVGRGAAA